MDPIGCHGHHPVHGAAKASRPTITLALVTVGIPTFFLAIRLLLHAVAPKSYGPAGGYDIYTAMVSGVLYVFGFIVAATLGATAGSVDLSEGMFRHLVVTGRSCLAIYLARIPAVAIIVPLVAVGFAIVCAVCVFAAPTHLSFDGVNVPINSSSAGFETWAADHPDEVICSFSFNIGPSSSAPTITKAINSVPCGNGPGGRGQIKAPPGSAEAAQASQSEIKNAARQIARADYSDYSRQFLYPSNSLMIKSGLWLELEVIIGFVVGLGLGSLIGQRTDHVVVMIVLEVVLTPILSRARIAHLSNVNGCWLARPQPTWLRVDFRCWAAVAGQEAGSGNAGLLPESTTVAICVIVAWLVGWTVLGVWRMMTRDA